MNYQDQAQPPVILAAFASLKMVKWLVSEDPDLFIARGDFYDIYPIHIAAAAGKVDIMAWILEKDSSMLRKINTEGELPIHYAIYAQDTTTLEFLFHQNPSLLTALDTLGKTPLDQSPIQRERAPRCMD